MILMLIFRNMDTNFNTGLSETEVQYKLKEYGLNKMGL